MVISGSSLPTEPLVSELLRMLAEALAAGPTPTGAPPPDGVLFSARRARLAGQLHPVRSDPAPEDIVRRWLMCRLERAEQAVPDRGADAEVHELSMVMESLESSQVGGAREV